MRIGISTPVVTVVPGVASAWEREAGISDITRIAEAADGLGFDYLTCSEHVAIDADVAAERGSTYWDPLATLAFLAARTTRIRLATSVIVLGYHHPLGIAKRYGTLDRVSNGRLVLGVGIGSLRSEFDLLGASWTDRGDRGDDALRALRASLSTPNPGYQGDYYRFDSVVVDPCAVQPHVPIWVGGRTARSLRRAREYADGWMPFGLSGNEITRLLGLVHCGPGFEIVLPTARIDPMSDRGHTQRQLDRLRDLGATAITCSIAATSAEHYCEQLAILSAMTTEVES
ncbi:LLM class F420-dependent oxidoreductase [Nocardia sp. CNY236]|uniref:LLM class F420-dependent oxidoreductase n=1 Tax=Nocardia sp. CNY236 TaxID=1169152 RepID=UPI0004093046|nr:LLM class F420-dependent oxidoreductase [Nocardia sp. CNY236]